MRKREEETLPKDPEAAAILARQGLRFRILRLVYDLAQGAVDLDVSVRTLQDRERVSRVDLDQVLVYLRDEKLINAARYSIYQVSLRHKGRVEMERAILYPLLGTQHFDAKVTSTFAKNRAGVMQGLRIAGEGEERERAATVRDINPHTQSLDPIDPSDRTFGVAHGQETNAVTIPP